MKNLIVYLIGSLWAVSPLSAQLKVDRNELEERKNISYYNDIPFTGDAYGYSRNTNEPMVMQYVDGIQNGYYTGYFEEERETVKWQVPVVDGKQHGPYTAYFKDGTISFTAYKDKGKLHGERICYTEDGTLWHIHHYHKGVEQGVRTVYNRRTGKLYSEEQYRKDKRHGAYARYYANGNIHITGRYKKGVKSGTWNTYDEEGHLLKTEKMKRGSKQK